MKGCADHSRIHKTKVLLIENMFDICATMLVDTVMKTLRSAEASWYL